jgi:putative molybdopterin biosynthesis protein
VKTKGIQLQYSFEADGQHGADVENRLFTLLSVLQQEGSIRHAAKAQGWSYRHFWGELRHWEEVLGQPLVAWAQGKRAVLTPFAQRLMWHERQARVRMTPHIEALRAELLHVLNQADGGRHEVLEVFASHDVALPRLQALLTERHELHLSLRYAGSEDALRSLTDGRCTVAGFHVTQAVGSSRVFARSLQPLLEPGLHKLIGSHRRVQGLMWRKDLSAPVTGFRDVADRGLRFANRQPGSGTRLLTDHLLEAAGVDAAAVTGYAECIEHTHVAVAATVASGAADVGVGVEAAARDLGLAFMPLVDEDYFLVCLKSALHTPALVRLREALASPAWAAILGRLAGYAPQRGGEVLALTRALPWWRYRSPRKARPTAGSAGA